MGLKAGRPSQNMVAHAVTLSDMSEGKDTKRVNFDVPAEEFRRLKMYAASHGLSIKDLFRRHIANLLNVRA